MSEYNWFNASHLFCKRKWLICAILWPFNDKKPYHVLLWTFILRVRGTTRMAWSIINATWLAYQSPKLADGSPPHSTLVVIGNAIANGLISSPGDVEACQLRLYWWRNLSRQLILVSNRHISIRRIQRYFTLSRKWCRRLFVASTRRIIAIGFRGLPLEMLVLFKIIIHAHYRWNVVMPSLAPPKRSISPIETQDENKDFYRGSAGRKFIAMSRHACLSCIKRCLALPPCANINQCA